MQKYDFNIDKQYVEANIFKTYILFEATKFYSVLTQFVPAFRCTPQRLQKCVLRGAATIRANRKGLVRLTEIA